MDAGDVELQYALAMTVAALAMRSASPRACALAPACADGGGHLQPAAVRSPGIRESACLGMDMEDAVLQYMLAADVALCDVLAVSGTYFILSIPHAGSPRAPPPLLAGDSDSGKVSLLTARAFTEACETAPQFRVPWHRRLHRTLQIISPVPVANQRGNDVVRRRRAMDATRRS